MDAGAGRVIGTNEQSIRARQALSKTRAVARERSVGTLNLDPCSVERTEANDVARTVRGLRWYIGGLLFLSTVINYIDRQTLSVLAPYLKTEYAWNNSDFALILIAFRVACAVGPTLA